MAGFFNKMADAGCSMQGLSLLQNLGVVGWGVNRFVWFIVYAITSKIVCRVAGFIPSRRKILPG